MTENEVLFRISNIVNGDASFAQAVDQIAALMDSFDPPRRSLYTFVDQQLGMLLIRTQLAERRAQLKREIAQIQEDLATRKLMQRAEGLLIARRAMSQAVAQRWIAQQSQKTGLSKNDVAQRIIAYYQATGLSERRIA
jgi:acetolactate synthase small subunit